MKRPSHIHRVLPGQAEELLRREYISQGRFTPPTGKEIADVVAYWQRAARTQKREAKERRNGGGQSLN